MAEIDELRERCERKVATRKYMSTLSLCSAPLSHSLPYRPTADHLIIQHHSFTISIATAIKSRITVHKLTPSKKSNIDFGAEIRNADLENISEVDFDVIRRALYEHQVIIFKG